MNTMDTDVQNLPSLELKNELGPFTGRMQKAVEDQIAALAEGMNACLQTAQGAANDPSGGIRSNDRRDAVKIAGATALLLNGLAKVKGSYRHDYNIRRAPEPPLKPRVKAGWSGREEDLLTQAEFDALNEFEMEDYTLWFNHEPFRFGGFKKKPVPEFASQNDLDELSAEVDRLGRVLRDRAPSPLENRGSNKDADES